MTQSVWLGLVAATVVLGQAFLIPRLRVPILQLGRQRQLAARQLAGRVAEVVDGAVEVHAHDTSNLERAELSTRLGRIFEIRYEIYRRKFFVKFLNNFLAQLTPFVFYAGGGLLAIYGQLDVGALVAVIAAYSDLPSPIKELIDWDQRRNDVQIKYEQVIDQFDPGEILEPALQDPDAADEAPLDGEIAVSAVTLLDDGDNRLIDSVSFNASIREHVAIVGPADSGKDHLALLLARLATPSSGRIAIGGHDLARLSEAVTGRHISYVAQDTHLFTLSLRDNLLYGLRHRPLHPPARDGAEAARHAARLSEARLAGNPDWDPDADWTDYAAAGATGLGDIDERIVAVLCLVDLEEDVYRFGLSATIDPEENPGIAEAILKARAALPERLVRENAESLVVRFDPDRYNPNATLGENLLFGTPRKREYTPGALAENPLMSAVLADAGLSNDMLDMGAAIARTMVEIFADLPAGHPFFEQFSFIDADDLPTFRALIAKLDKQGAGALEADEALALRRLPIKYVEARHRLGLIDEAFEARAIAARRMFAERLGREDPNAVAFYRPDAYNAAASLQDNILFGRIAYGQAKAEQIVGAAMTDSLDGLGLRRSVVVAGLDHEVGIAGKRLSAIQRQKVGLARALLKRPDILIVNDALVVMDLATQRRLMERVLERRKERGVVWILQRL
ncbi:MAG: ATP-binding cassette domain-containing protein, partial [Kiloniellaceae bacterium]